MTNDITDCNQSVENTQKTLLAALDREASANNEVSKISLYVYILFIY